MKVILFMAQTVNGVIARTDFSEDFLSDENWGVFVRLAEEAGCFIVGRRTYEEVKKWVDYDFDGVKAKRIVVSSNPSFRVSRGYEIASSPKEALKKAKRFGVNRVILAGGGAINSAFMKDKLVDEIILNIEPVVLGSGISIFHGGEFESKLNLIHTRKLKSGILQLHYAVI